MAGSTTDLSPEARATYDAIIDVRSPAEFAEDHLPGAINLPVLDDAQRAEIGTIYVQTSKFLARRQGAAMVARNIAAHLEGPLAERTGGFRPLVYCWRGGQRSGAMATVMSQVGWPVTRLEGGYQTWRRRVLSRLYDPAAHGPDFRCILLDGPTGSGKTAVLGLLAERGVQVLDLEGLAHHRGSLFGASDRAPTAPAPVRKPFAGSPGAARSRSPDRGRVRIQPDWCPDPAAASVGRDEDCAAHRTGRLAGGSRPIQPGQLRQRRGRSCGPGPDPVTPALASWTGPDRRVAHPGQRG